MEKQLKYDPQKVAEFEHATWSRCAASYMEGFGILGAEAIAPLLEATKVSRGDRVLDIGTGPGPVAGAATRRGANVVGIDFSETMLAEARKRYPRLEFFLASAESLPFKDAEFDVVVGNLVLHHSASPDDVLRESLRVLKDNGRAGFTVWADPSHLEAFGVFFAAVEQHAEGDVELPHGPLFGISDFEVFHQMMRTAGFREPSARELPIEWKTGAIEPFIASFSDWANLEAFPREVSDRIKITARENANTYRKENKFVMPNPVILISGIK